MIAIGTRLRLCCLPPNRPSSLRKTGIQPRFRIGLRSLSQNSQSSADTQFLPFRRSGRHSSCVAFRQMVLWR